MRPLAITRQLQIDLAIYNTGVEKAKDSYYADEKPTPTDAEREDAVNAVLVEGRTLVEVADPLDVSPETVGRWVALARMKARL